MKEQFFRPLECSTDYGVTVGHSVTFIRIAHMTVILHHNLRLYGFYSFIAEITFCWSIVNIRQHVYVSHVPPHYCPQFSPGPYMNFPLFNFVFFGVTSCGMPLLFALTVPQQYMCFMSYVYPVRSRSLKNLMPIRLRFFGIYCLKTTLPLKATITLSIARFSEGFKIWIMYYLEFQTGLVSSIVCHNFRLSYQVHSCCQ